MANSITRGSGRPTTPTAKIKQLLVGSKIMLSGEYLRMKDTFHSLTVGLSLAVLLIYFTTVALDKSFMVPFCVHSAVPLILVGVLPMLYFTGSAINVQSLLGIIFSIGIKVANTILMTDMAQHLRHHEGLSPLEAIRKAAKMRVRPITMTALAAFMAPDPDRAGARDRQRGQCPPGPRHPRRAACRRTRHAVHRSRTLRLDDSRHAGGGRGKKSPAGQSRNARSWACRSNSAGRVEP